MLMLLCGRSASAIIGATATQWLCCVLALLLGLSISWPRLPRWCIAAAGLYAAACTRDAHSLFRSTYTTRRGGRNENGTNQTRSWQLHFETARGLASRPGLLFAKFAPRNDLEHVSYVALRTATIFTKVPSW